MSKKYHCVVICHWDRTYNHPTYFGKNKRLRSEPKYMKHALDDFAPKLLFPSWCYRIFSLERILVALFNSADLVNLVVTCTADCTCHHLSKNVYFLSEMWNLKQIRDLAIANVARFPSLNAVFLSWTKNTTAWLYVTVTGHITIQDFWKKRKAWGANQSILNTHSMILPLTYCFQADATVFFLLERNLVGLFNSADLVNLVVTCTADFTCHHLTKNKRTRLVFYFLNRLSLWIKPGRIILVFNQTRNYI